MLHISQKYTAWSSSWQITQDYPLYCSQSFYSKTKKRVRGIVRQKLKTTQSSAEWCTTAFWSENEVQHGLLCAWKMTVACFSGQNAWLAFSVIFYVYCMIFNQYFKDEHDLCKALYWYNPQNPCKSWETNVKYQHQILLTRMLKSPMLSDKY